MGRWAGGCGRGLFHADEEKRSEVGGSQPGNRVPSSEFRVRAVRDVSCVRSCVPARRYPWGPGLAELACPPPPPPLSPSPPPSPRPPRSPAPARSSAPMASKIRTNAPTRGRYPRGSMGSTPSWPRVPQTWQMPLMAAAGLGQKLEAKDALRWKPVPASRRFSPNNKETYL